MEEERERDQTYSRTKLVNVILLGLVFMTTGSRTPISIQKTVLYSAKQVNSTAYVPGLTGDGYLANSLLYATFSVSNFFAPWVIEMIGPRLSMVIGSLGYTAYSAQLLYLSDLTLYTAAVLNGVGASLLWTGQGNFLSINSSQSTAARDAGIFWSLYQLSGVLGNIAVYFLFLGVTFIRTDIRIKTAATFTCLCLTGLVIALGFRPTPWHRANTTGRTNPLTSLTACLRLLVTRDIFLLSGSFLYSGLEISYWAGVLPSSISFTQHLGQERKSLMGLCSVLVSVGSMTGGLLLITFQEAVSRTGRVPVVVVGMVTHLAAFALSLVFLPNLSPLGETDLPALSPPSAWPLLLTAALLGLGDAALNTQIISLLSTQYKENSAHAFALMKLIQSVGVSGGFAVSSRLGLYWQLLILGTSLLLATAGFVWVEVRTRRLRSHQTTPPHEMETLKTVESSST